MEAEYDAARQPAKEVPMRPKTASWIVVLAFSMAVAVPVQAVFAEAAVPETAADHLALAKKYTDKAAEYRKEAAEHKEMAEAYKKAVPGPSKGGTPNPWAKKMEAHCAKIAKDAQALAADADKAAEYHALRAKELQGK
jgi:hypothetical protein